MVISRHNFLFKKNPMIIQNSVKNIEYYLEYFKKKIKIVHFKVFYKILK